MFKSDPLARLVLFSFLQQIYKSGILEGGFSAGGVLDSLKKANSKSYIQVGSSECQAIIH